MLLAADWAGRHGRRLLVLSVDHGLQPQSADWTRFVEAAAERIGADFRALAWSEPKPSRGLPAAARAARHRLIAEAARQAGARVVVFGHTYDDVLEAALMRAEGSSVGAPHEWAPSPSWPQGRDLFLLRPLLGARRAAIRAFLRRREELWIEDPANADPASSRARARLRLAGRERGGSAVALSAEASCVANLALASERSPLGFIRMDREALRRAPRPAARRALAAAALSAGGGERAPRRDRVERLLTEATGSAPFKATLAGARIVGAADLLITREPGEIARGGLARLSLNPGAAVVWDGRFEVVASEARLAVAPLAGLAARLNPDDRRALAEAPAPVRPGLPVLVDADGSPCAAILSDASGVSVRSLVGARFLAACGAISKEPAT
jgi:tRNA(Ile)-lysidine synthase